MAVGWASSDPSYLQSDWRAAIWTLTITPPTADEAIGVLDHAVADSPLGSSEAGALDAKLAAAARQCERGNETAARNQIDAFIQQVHAFANAGKLTAEEANDLIALANEVLDELSC
jgi:hypothetical protein